MYFNTAFIDKSTVFAQKATLYKELYIITESVKAHKEFNINIFELLFDFSYIIETS